MIDPTLKLFIGLAVEAVREEAPSVQIVTPPPMASFVGEVLAATGARPVFAPESMAAHTDALLICGTPSDARALAETYRTHGRPWALNLPVKPSESGLLDLAPTLVRMPELEALPQGVGIVTGHPVVIQEGQRTVQVPCAVPGLERLFGIDAIASALAAACSAVAPPFEAAIAASAWVTLAAERAAESSRGPGSMRVSLVDEIALLHGDEIAERVDLA